MRSWGAAALAAVCLLALPACGDDATLGPLRPTPPPAQEQVLRDLPLAALVRESFGTGELQAVDGTNVEDADGSSYRLLGRLVGRLHSPEDLAMAAFLDYGPGGGGRPEGVYVAFVSLDGNGRPRYQRPAVLTASGAGIEPVARGGEPFRQNRESVEGMTAVSPSLVLDLEGDGLEEMALLVRTRREGVSFEHYDVYRREGESEWRRAAGTVDAPGLAALQYWASIGAAVAIAGRWEPEERLRVVWPWLAEEGVPVDPEVVADLVPDGDPGELEAAQEALIFLRAFFDEGHKRFSDGFRVRQPWPAFINGFKSTEAVKLISVSPPVLEHDGTATVDVLLDLTQREGDEPVVRRFLVETVTAQQGREWYLDGVSAEEQRY